MMKIVNKILHFLLLVVALVIQITFFEHLKMFYVYFDLILIMLVAVTLVDGAFYGIIFGFIIDYFLKGFFDNRYFIPSCFIVNAAILVTIKKIPGKRDKDNINTKDSLLLGILQGIAIFPGISRAGITIAGLLRRNFNTADAFTLSFIMAIPVIIATFIFKFRYLLDGHLMTSQITIGFIAAFISGLAALSIVKKVLAKAKLNNFGYYCLLIAIVGLLI